MELFCPKKPNTLNKTLLGETGCSNNLYYLLAAQASSFLINFPFPNTVSWTIPGSPHLTVHPLCDLQDAMPPHWSPSASHLTLAYGSRGFR